MVIDTSVLVSILLSEPEAPSFLQAISADTTRIVGAPTIVETAAVLMGRMGTEGGIALDALLQRLSIRVEPFSPAAADSARSAYEHFGKGVGSPGVLNYGDCLSYGLAMSLQEPLLFKGADFSQTDVKTVTLNERSAAAPTP